MQTTNRSLTFTQPHERVFGTYSIGGKHTFRFVFYSPPPSLTFPNNRTFKGGDAVATDEVLWQMAYESDFGKACDILGYDSEDLTEDQKLEVDVFLMTAEEI